MFEFKRARLWDQRYIEHEYGTDYYVVKQVVKANYANVSENSEHI